MLPFFLFAVRTVKRTNKDLNELDKRSSVSWLLTTAIKMCAKFPNSCLQRGASKKALASLIRNYY